MYYHFEHFKLAATVSLFRYWLYCWLAGVGNKMVFYNLELQLQRTNLLYILNYAVPVTESDKNHILSLFL